MSAEAFEKAINEAARRADDYSDPFYVPPPSFDTTPGAVIRTQDARHLLDPSVITANATARKMLYTSTTQHGEPVAVSGFVVDPIVPWPGQGPTPTLVISPGTRGAADWCAPSRGDFMLSSVNLKQPSPGLMVNYEWIAMYHAVLTGVRVIMTDHIGLGTPGKHTYVNNFESGRALLDAARAGLTVVNAPADSPIALYGYSQGGGGAAAAAELAATYAPDLNVVGTYSGGPPADLPEVLSAVVDSAISGVAAYSLISYSARYPEIVYRTAAEELNSTGLKFLIDNATDCITGSAARWGMYPSRSLTKSGKTVDKAFTDHPEVRAMLADQRLGSSKLNAPILVASAINDDIIPVGQVRQLVQDYCAVGNTVTYREITLPSVTANIRLAADHALPLLENEPVAFDWIYARFNGESVPNSCGA